MEYIVFSIASWKIYRFVDGRQAIYNTRLKAVAQHTRLVNQRLITAGEWGINTYMDWSKRQPLITVQNLLTGVEVKIKASDVGNPALDPSMEGYWTM